MSQKISLRFMHSLIVDVEKNAGVRAASGLIKKKNSFLVIADDELTLATFNFESKSQTQLSPLLKGILPEDPVRRKKLKPDWEALVEINEMILAVPSGSTQQRMIGAYLDKNCIAHEVDFAKLYSELGKSIAELNIEGACVFKNKLKLFQRGNGAQGKNAVIDLDLSGVCDDLQSNSGLKPHRIQSINEYSLGTLNGFKLDFTDACALDETIWFLAVAENSASTYEDGPYHGALVGCLDANGSEIARYEIDCATKPEGLWVEREANRICFYIVTDADNRNVFASLYFGKLSLQKSS